MNTNFETIVLDLDNSVVQQKDFLKAAEAIVLPLQERGEVYRFWCTHFEMLWLRNQLARAANTNKPKVVLYGSGDQHHLAYLGISMVEEPVTVIHFDNHTDWWSLGVGDHYLGKWVTRVLRDVPHVRRIVQFGIDGDLGRPATIPIWTGTATLDFRPLLEGRVETYPHRLQTSTFQGKISGQTRCVRFEPGSFSSVAHWQNMHDHGGVAATFERVLETIETDAVYMSLDKDCLAVTENFSAYSNNVGSLTVDEVCSALALVARRKRIVGVDICGDGSALATMRSVGKLAFAHYRREYAFKEFFDERHAKRNSDVNTRILAALHGQS